MKERPILFNGEMVRAILDGRKTQTRRVIKLPYTVPDGWYPDRYNKEPNWTFWGPRKSADSGKCMLPTFTCPQGEPGDRLWVRETWGPCEGGFCYRASENPRALPDDGRWHPSIHMFREASRITLEIESVRVERVQEITQADARSEGVESEDFLNRLEHAACVAPDGAILPSPRSEFENLWDSINARRGFGWDVNPWVWVITFRRVK